MTQRINTMLSIPMLYGMVAQQNAGASGAAVGAGRAANRRFG